MKLKFLEAAESALGDLSDMSETTAADSLALLGRIDKLRGDYHQAVDDCAAARELDPNNAEAIGNEVNALIALVEGRPSNCWS